eukprot:CAMPEP_0183741872 /NCGR_PEP_ID=MMETSP0737-20130205/63318_1 /TAXON_ID=385413 /ORGANISM="Thalassiosira miniscula, Strain CCMP1093" /LENGTH=854 /DNA_ID=CAMNT_0025977353 /DNA_START=73 /DNA_END=2637 /DNA_ORIENTATION=+
MGNSQSTDKPCGNSPLCRALCWGKAPPANDDGEWFGDLPREKKRNRRKSHRSTKNMDKMPAVPEEDTIETASTEESRTSSGDDAVANVVAGAGNDIGAESKPSLSQSSTLPLRSKSESQKKMAESLPPLSLQRGSSEPTNSPVQKGSKKKSKRQPKVKLTFVNGQFVDLSTKKGKELVEAASSEGGTNNPIGGIIASFDSGHQGIIGRRTSMVIPESNSAPGQISPALKSPRDEPPSALKSPRNESPSAAKSSVSFSSSVLRSKTEATSSLGSFSSSVSAIRSKSNFRTSSSIDSIDSLVSSSSLDTHTNRADAVTSILALGEGKFLTASNHDRVIKMWRVEEKDNSETITFIRDFVGHNTGITCLAKVCAKGRFLSASKDRVIKLWDSDSERFLLATFDNMDRRKISSIAITESGDYVRPTDQVDMAMATAMTMKALKEGSGSVQKAARERQIIACSCEFASISGSHKEVKLWSMKHVDQNEQTLMEEENVAEVKLEQDLKHDNVVESITAACGKGMILTGDRMGTVRLWRSTKNVFLPGTARIWSCARTFTWRRKSELYSVDECMQFAITSLCFLQGNAMFVSGSKIGNLRVWSVDGSKTNGETVNKELICITGAHNMAVTTIRQGPRVEENGSNANLSFSSAADDGKVLSFAIPVAKIGSCNPSCFNVVNHGIANRYLADSDPIGVSSLECLSMPGSANDILLSGCANNGSINLLMPPDSPRKGTQNDALLLYRQAIEQESLTLYAIAEKMSKGGVESRNRKLQMRTYKNVFLGKDAVSYLVENGYAASRNDAIALGRVLATHLSLFECATKRGKLLEDDTKSFYRWTDDFLNGSKKEKLRKLKTDSDISM